MKRIITKVLALSIIVLMLSGCGDDSSPIQKTPEKIMDMVGKDMDGNDVRIGDYIAPNKVTLINYWGTTCKPCVEEMPILDSYLQKYGDQGFYVIGFCNDVLDSDNSIEESQYADCEKIIADTGITYPIILTTEELNKFVDSSATPVSFFMDQSGKLIGDPIFGAKSEEQWDEIISEKLSGVK